MTSDPDEPNPATPDPSPSPRRSPAEVARQFGDIVKAGAIILGWGLVAATSLAATYVVVRALLWIVQLASKTFAM